MAKVELSKLFTATKLTLAKKSPEILTGLGIVGMITTTVLAVKATPKAIRLMEQTKEEKGEELTTKDKLKVSWKCYIPATITGLTSVACLIGASSVNARRNAALATAYKLSEKAFIEYKDKVTEMVGEKKEKLVRDEVNKDRLEQHQQNKSEVIIIGDKTSMCLDPLSGRFFTSSIEKIKNAEIEINRRMTQDISGYVSLNEFYDELGLDHIPIGNDLGWNLDMGKVTIDFSTLLKDDGTPSIVLDYLVAPKYGYANW